MSISDGCTLPGNPYGALCASSPVGVLSAGTNCASVFNFNWTATQAEAWVATLGGLTTMQTPDGAHQIAAMQAAIAISAQHYGPSAITQSTWTCGPGAAPTGVTGISNADLRDAIQAYDSNGIFSGFLDCSKGHSEYDGQPYLASQVGSAGEGAALVAAFPVANSAALVCDGTIVVYTDPPPINGLTKW